MSSYPLSGNVQLPFCRGRWDKDKKIFVDSNSLEVLQCCLDSCKDRINYCFDTCSQVYGADKYAKKNCFDRCDDLIKNCENGCLENRFGGLKIISDCAEENKCGKYPLFRSECLREKKNDIIACCSRKCVTDQSIDCETNLCLDFYNNLEKGNQGTLPRVLEKNTKQDQKDDNMKYLFLIIFVLLFALGIYIILN